LSVSLQTKNKPAETNRHWKNLQTLLLHSPLNSDFLLKQAFPVPPPPGFIIAQLFQSCGSDRRRLLLKRHLLSSFALFNAPLGEFQAPSGMGNVVHFFPDIDHITFTSACWTAVPVPVVQRGGASVLTLMFGLTTGKGRLFCQSTPRIDQSSRKALETVLQSSFLTGVEKENDLFVWTLQEEDSSPLKGASLGLPATIGLNLLRRRKRWPEGLFASGEITAEGHIRPVKYLKEKRRAISRESQLFIIPKQYSHLVSGNKTVSVQSFEEAILAVNCFHNDILDGDSIALFQLAAKDPELLLDQFRNLPVEFFHLYELSTVLEKIQQAPERYLARVASCLRENSYKLEQAKWLASLYTCDEIQQLAAVDEFNALEYCLGRLALHNHSGDIEKSQKWSVCAEEISTALMGRKELSRLVNNSVLNERFNRYDFRTEIPSIFSKCLEYEIQLHDLQGDDSWRLGAMYGTLTQNYGFCGPAYFENLKVMAQKALSTFGRKYKKEHSRIQAYLIYALLDSHNWAEAKLVLRQYLDLPKSTTAHEWLNKLTAIKEDHWHDYTFKASLVCRFLADQQSLLENILLDSTEFQRLIHETLQQAQHPWQLTATNLARLCLHSHKQGQAVQLLTHAISICKDNGETMQVMALLPLSLLYEYGFAKKLHYQQAEQIQEMIRSNNILNQSHFTDILSCQSGQDILERTAEKRSSLFPFSYR